MPSSNVTPLDPALLPLLERQLGLELDSYMAYSQAANLADGWGLAALVKYFDAEAAQEVSEHVTLLREYLRDRCICHLPAVAAPGVAEDLAGLLTDLLALMREVTANLNAIAQLAGSAHDAASLELVLPLLKGQVQAEKGLDTALLKLGRGAPLDLLEGYLFE